MSHLEPAHSHHEFLCKMPYLHGMTIITFRKAADNHVGISHSLHFVRRVILNGIIKQSGKN